ncbi:MAG: hypothetical protein JXA71_07240 [Chitinispirillaceae bacterium]|nr:hypothetical protein [Chitinispirillaceae bacterium]
MIPDTAHPVKIMVSLRRCFLSADDSFLKNAYHSLVKAYMFTMGFIADDLFHGRWNSSDGERCHGTSPVMDDSAMNHYDLNIESFTINRQEKTLGAGKNAMTGKP